jgi:hypothetical protein
MLGSRGGVTDTLGGGAIEVAYRTIIKISWHRVAKSPHIHLWWSLCVIRTCSVDCAASAAVLGTVSTTEALALRVCNGLACPNGLDGSCIVWPAAPSGGSLGPWVSRWRLSSLDVGEGGPDGARVTGCIGLAESIVGKRRGRRGEGEGKQEI